MLGARRPAAAMLAASHRPSVPEFQQMVEYWETDPMVRAMSWRGLFVWPVARILFHSFARSTRPVAPAPEVPPSSPPPPSLQEIGAFPLQVGQAVEAFFGDFVKRQVASRLTPCDILLVSNAVNAYVTVKGRPFDPFLDSLYLLFRDQYRFAKLEILEGNSHLPRLIEPLVLDAEPFLHFATSVDSFGIRLAASVNSDRVRGFEAFRRMQVETLGCPVIGEAEIVTTARRIELMSRLFKLVYSLARPKLVLMVDFAHIPSAAACKAASDLGITCADVQHGGGAGGRHTIKWSPWTGIPPEEYSLLPHFFWVWGERTRKGMLEGRPDPAGPHQPIVGGHPWLTLRGDVSFASFRDGLPPELEQRMAQATKRIVVTLPNAIETVELNVLIEAMVTGPRDWLWLLRLHPTDRLGCMGAESFLSERIGLAGGAEFEIRWSNCSNMADLLERADVHLTDNSASCLEALEFGVPTVIYGIMGRQVYGDYIREGVFQEADTASRILAAIGQAKRPTGGFIETRKECAEAVLERLVHHVSRIPAS